MLTIYLSYLRAFRQYANFLLNASTEFVQIGKYANSLTEKADSLVRRAALNDIIDLNGLQKDMFDAGSIFIKKFAGKHKGIRLRGNKNKNDYFKFAVINSIPQRFKVNDSK